MNHKNRLEKLEQMLKKKKEIIFQFDDLPTFKNEKELQKFLKEIESEIMNFERIEN